MQKNNTDYTGMPNDLHRELLDGCHIRARWAKAAQTLTFAWSTGI